MRKIILCVLLSVLLLSGCKGQSDKIDDAVSPTVQETQDITIQEEQSTEIKTEEEKVDKTVISTDEEASQRAFISDELPEEKKLLEQWEEIKSEENESVDSKTYVYKFEYLESYYSAMCDFGICLITENNRQYLTTCLSLYPTEAVRETENGYYIVYDTEENIRLFVWFEPLTGEPYYHQMGYPIYMSKSLSYNDFAEIAIGDDALEVEAIDPEVVRMSLEFHREEEEVQHTQTAIENGFPPKSIHLLTDGVVIFTYGRNEEGFFVSEIEYNEDFEIDTVRGPQCCKIDPLDYVTQG